MIIRKAVIEDIPKVSDLVNLFYNYNWIDEWYKWQCFDNPLPSVFMVAEIDKEIVGMFGLQIKKLRNNQLNEYDIRIGQIVWINIHDTWKDQGLFSKMGHEVISSFENLDGLCIVSNKKALKDCQEGIGLKNAGVLNRLILNIQDKKIKEYSAICEKVGPNTHYKTIKSNREIFMFEKTSDFRVWRFSSNPVYTYFKVTIPSGEYAIVKQFFDIHPDSPKVCIGDIVDFECDIDNQDKLEEVFSAAIYQLEKKGSQEITTWANPCSTLRNVLGRIGFTEGSNNGYFGFNALNPNLPVLSEYDRWHLVQSDATNY
jgi:hypothetical protein